MKKLLWYDKRINNYIDNVLKGSDKIKEQNKKFSPTIYIDSNLTMFFSETSLLVNLKSILMSRNYLEGYFSRLSMEEFEALIIDKLLYLLLTEKEDTIRNNPLFCAEIQKAGEYLYGNQNFLVVESGVCVRTINFWEIIDYFYNILMWDYSLRL